MSMTRSALNIIQVSPTYAKEVAGNSVISPHLYKFHGIINGIDPDIWDPYNDNFIPVSFITSSPFLSLDSFLHLVMFEHFVWFLGTLYFRERCRRQKSSQGRIAKQAWTKECRSSSSRNYYALNTPEGNTFDQARYLAYLGTEWTGFFSSLIQPLKSPVVNFSQSLPVFLKAGCLVRFSSRSSDPK